MHNKNIQNDMRVERNKEGYIDPTLDGVLKREKIREKLEKEKANFKIMKRDIKKLLKMNGYIIEGPISLINIHSGKRRRMY